MRPLRLEFQGLHSYRDPVAIDFARLTEGGFFGIFGPTGAGKSTILDAITFALFGRIDRSASLADSLTSGERSLWARFRFALGGRTYEVYRKAERRRAGIASVDFYLARDGERLPLEGVRQLDRAVEEILGLSFEQFVTAAFLPQGKFARFLRLKPAERRALLAEIFRLERFGDPLYRAVREARGRLEAERGALAAELASLEGISPAGLEELEAEVATLRGKAEELRGELSRLEERRRRAEEFLRLAAEVADLKGKFAGLVGRPWDPEAAEAIRERLGIAAQAEELVGVVDRCERLRRELEAKGAELARVEGERRAHERRRALFEEEARRKLEELSRREAAYRELKGKVAGLDPERVQTLFERAARLKRELDGLPEGESPPFPPELLPAVEEAAAGAGKLLPALEEARRRERELAAAREELEREVAALRERVAGLKGELARAEAASAAARARWEDLRREHLAATLATSLAPGEPCPVCGSPHHPAPAAPPPEGALEDAQRELERLEGEEKGLREALAAAEAELGVKEGLRAQRERELDEARAGIRSLEEKLEGLRADLPPAIASLPWEELAATLPRWRGALRRESLARDLGETRAELARLEGIWKEVLAGLGEFYEPLRPELLARYRAELERRLRETRAARERVERNLEAFRARGEELAAREAGLRGEAAELGRALRAAEEEMRELAARIGVPPGEAGALVLSADDRARLEEGLEISVKLADLEGRLAALPFRDPDAARAALEEYTAKRDEYEGLRQRLGEAEERLRGYRERLSRKRALEERARALDGRLGLYRELEGLLRGKAFLEFLVGSQFERILSRASHYTAHLSQGRYVLDGEGTELLVIDYRHGGLARPPHTLSGGETFLISLSLALALSEAIQLGRRGGAPPIEFFFIDEGFGSLDEESVRMVLELLYRLVDEGLRVGVITHVEALRRGIPHKLLVYPPDGDRGSRVELVIGE